MEFCPALVRALLEGLNFDVVDVENYILRSIRNTQADCFKKVEDAVAVNQHTCITCLWRSKKAARKPSRLFRSNFFSYEDRMPQEESICLLSLSPLTPIIARLCPKVNKRAGSLLPSPTATREGASQSDR